ncbi:BON domain-containing protein [Mycoplana sp. MJR14]|uniref:BON domain-containing protein n=1 Tax=Mycoplana sp. MJR14 TaxID=3032583 RepID=UPI0023DA0150|nr:BON domain-containing protein [Mycoplana sp. MJR14]MDF1631198.1 BON domain-containing protein [Mycoplana sp. MJR14]
MANDYYRRQEQREAGRFGRDQDDDRGRRHSRWMPSEDDDRERRRFSADWDDDSRSGREFGGREREEGGYRGTSFGERVGGGFGGQYPGRGYGEFESDTTRGSYGERRFGGEGRDRGRDMSWNESGRKGGYSGQARGQFQGRGPKGYERSDSRIREDVCDRLCDDASIDATEIEVSVEKGEITLSGTVESRDQKRRAEDCIEDVSGVKNVQNNLRVAPQSSSGASNKTSTSASSMSEGRSEPGMGGEATKPH